MPELPEVETVRKGLEVRLRDFNISRLEILREKTIASKGGSKRFIQILKGSQVGGWQRRGKYLIAPLLRGNPHLSIETVGWWAIHLRMTGYFQFHEQFKLPCPHTRVRIWDNKGLELRFVDIRSFGQMWSLPAEESPYETIQGIKNLGPEPFDKFFNKAYLRKRFERKTCSIKTALLDQAIIAGIGNIYADESLFTAGILPQKKCCDLKSKELEKLCLSIIDTLKVSIGKGGTSFSDFRDLEGLNGNYGGQAWVYRRTNMPCRKCGSQIRREKISGRSTHWCANCQE